MTGQTTFLIHSPWFEHLKINLGGGKELVVNSTGGDKDTSIHVQSLKVNGQDWRKSWLAWDDIFARGGTMNFVLGPDPNDAWFDNEDLPPSPASSSAPPDRRSKDPVETVRVKKSTAADHDIVAADDRTEGLDQRYFALLSLLIVAPTIMALGLILWRVRRRRLATLEPEQHPLENGKDRA